MSTTIPSVACNVAVVGGACSVATVRSLDSGARLATFSIRAPGRDRATSVPAAWWEPPAWMEVLADGEAVVAVGRVVRRFYRTGAGTGSKVELEVERLARTGRAREMQALMRCIHGAMEVLR